MALKDCLVCGGADYVGLEMRCVAVECGECSGTGKSKESSMADKHDSMAPASVEPGHVDLKDKHSGMAPADVKPGDVDLKDKHEGMAPAAVAEGDIDLKDKHAGMGKPNEDKPAS